MIRVIKVSIAKLKPLYPHFAFDGCHKIYLLANQDQIDDARGCGYDILPIEALKETYENSCPLRFINTWVGYEPIVGQCEDAEIIE